jgi:cbb3-type cytochrome oxidase subunit 3
MKLVGQFLREIGFAVHMQSMVSLAFFLIFLFILYIVIRSNSKEYKAYGNLPLEDDIISENINSQEKN